MPITVTEVQLPVPKILNSSMATLSLAAVAPERLNFTYTVSAMGNETSAVYDSSDRSFDPPNATPG